MIRRLCLVLVGLVVVVGLVTPPVDAAPAVATVGWWTDRTGAAPLGDGAVEVAQAFDGTSVAAVRIVDTGAVDEAVLVLTETGAPPSAEAGIGVCPTSAAWVPADGGALEDAPTTDCDSPVELERGVDRTWRADVTALVASTDEVGLAIVPLPGAVDDTPLGAVTPGFTAQFGTVELRATTDGEPPPTTQAPPSSTVPPPTTVDETETTTPTTAPARPTNTIAPTPQAPVASTTTVARSVEPISEPVDDDAADELAVPSFTNGPISGGGDGAPWVRLVILVPLSALAGYGAVLLGRLRLRG